MWKSKKRTGGERWKSLSWFSLWIIRKQWNKTPGGGDRDKFCIQEGREPMGNKPFCRRHEKQKKSWMKANDLENKGTLLGKKGGRKEPLHCQRWERVLHRRTGEGGDRGTVSICGASPGQPQCSQKHQGWKRTIFGKTIEGERSWPHELACRKPSSKKG